jgi:hypothetical protein
MLTNIISDFLIALWGAILPQYWTSEVLMTRADLQSAITAAGPNLDQLYSNLDFGQPTRLPQCSEASIHRRLERTG